MPALLCQLHIAQDDDFCALNQVCTKELNYGWRFSNNYFFMLAFVVELPVNEDSLRYELLNCLFQFHLITPNDLFPQAIFGPIFGYILYILFVAEALLYRQLKNSLGSCLSVRNS